MKKTHTAVGYMLSNFTVYTYTSYNNEKHVISPKIYGTTLNNLKHNRYENKLLKIKHTNIIRRNIYMFYTLNPV